MKRAPFLALLLALLLTPGLALAGGYYNPDFGTRRVGMLAVIGNPEDPSAVFHNPAAMVTMTGTHLYHSQTWTMADTGIKLYDSKGVLHPTGHEIGPDWNLGFSPYFGLVTDLGTQKFRLGAALFAPNAFAASLPDDEPSRYHVTDAIFVAGRATVAGAYSFTDRFSVGLSFSLLSVYLYAQRWMNPLVLNDPDARFEDPEVLSPLDAKLTLDGFDLTWSMDAALFFRPTKDLRLGAVFGKGAPISLEGTASLKKADGTTDHSHQTTFMTIPFQLQGGLNWEFVPDFEVGLDVRYWHYQVFVEQRTLLSTPLMEQEELVEPKNYHNSVALALGLLHRVTPTVTVMMGVQRDYSPVPQQSVGLENPVGDRLGIATGLRWQLRPDLRLGLGILRNWFDMMDIQDSITTPPTNAKGHGGITSMTFDVDWRL